MKYKKIVITIMFVIFLFSITSISASEIDTSMAGGDTGQLELSVNEECIRDNLQEDEENFTLALIGNEETLSVQTDTDVLSADSATYSELAAEISQSGNIKLTHKNYTYNDGATSITINEVNKVIDGDGAVIDMAGSNICAFTVSASGVTIKNLTIKNANLNSGKGGAIFFRQSGTVTNCNFVNNSASELGGAIRFDDEGTVTNCNFNGNKAYCGSAIYFKSSGTVTNCNFTNNIATEDGGAVYFYSKGNVTNCNFTNNSASESGGAIRMYSGTVSNCNFTNNQAKYGGAVYFYSNGNVTNCNFTNNSATIEGGAIRFSNTGTVTNCNFNGNKATGNNGYGGAVHFFNGEGTVTNCNFTKNTATKDGGAVYFYSNGNVENCNFVHNSATRGGAILSQQWWAVTADTCIFKTDSDKTFNTHNLPPTLNIDNFTAVYGSGDKLTFDLRTNLNPVTNGNISISVYVKDNDIWVGNYSCLSGEGWIPDLLVGSYYAIFDTEYAEFQPINRTITITIPNDNYYINVTSLTTHNKTVNITAKTNIPKNLFWESKLLFILPNSGKINAIYAGNGIWWTPYTFDAYDFYHVNAAYVGLDNVTINNATISISKTPTNITVENTTVDLFVRNSVAIGATLTPADAGNLNYISSNSSVAKVEDGKIIAVGEGTAIITVSFAGSDVYAAENKTITVTVTLNDASVSVNNSTLNLFVDDTFTIVPTTKPEGLTVTFVPDDSGVYSVDENGVVTALKEGKGSILVKVGGDGVYAENSTTVGVTVSKIPTEIILVNSTVDLKVNNEIEAGATLTPADAGNLTFTSSKSSVAKVEGDKIIAVSEGTAIITVSFAGDNKYAAENKTITVNVKSVATKVTVENVTAHPGDKINISVNITADDKSALKGNMNVILPDGKSNTAKIINGKGNIIWTVPDNYTEGNYTIKVSYPGDDRHKPYEVEGKVNIIRYNSKVTISPIEDVDYGNNVTIKYIIENTTTVNVNIDGISQDKIIITNDTITIIGLNTGKHTITILNKENNKYESSNDTKEFNVNKVDSTLNIADITFDYNKTGSTTLSYDGATGVNASVINHPEAIVNVKDNKIEISGLNAGTYTLTVTTIPDANHNTVTETVTLTVNKVDSSLIVGNIVFNYNSSGSADVTFDGATGVNVNVVNHPEAIVNVKDNNVEISGLNAGTYILTVTTIPDDNHNPVTKTVPITVNKLKTKLVGDAINTTYPIVKDLVISLKDINGNPLSGKNVSVDLNGVKIYVSDVNGQIKVSTGDLAPNSYVAKVTFDEDVNYEKSTAEIDVTITADKILVSAPELIKYVSGPEQFVVNVLSAESKPMADMEVKITINGVTYTKTTNNDGVASLNVGLGSGEYPVNVLVDGIEVNSTVTVNSTTDANDLVKVFRNASQYSAKFVDGNGTPLVNAPVSFNINGIIYHRLTDENGSAKLNINLEAGDYILTATNPVTGEMRSNLIKVISLIDSDDLTKYYKNASQFVVRIHSSDGGYAGAGEEVKFNINGVIYTRTTNATGHAVLNINLGQGNYTITTYYKDCIQGNNIEVLPILSADNLVMKYMDGSQFKAKLVDGQGKTYPNQTVTFNIHGIFYDRVTDSDGVAKLNIRLMAGEYIITSSYNGCNIANTIKITA